MTSEPDEVIVQWDPTGGDERFWLRAVWSRHTSDQNKVMFELQTEKASVAIIRTVEVLDEYEHYDRARAYDQLMRAGFAVLEDLMKLVRDRLEGRP